MNIRDQRTENSLLRELKTQLAELGHGAVKLRGQHFLIDEKALAVMVTGVKKGECVLEIGSGLGVLTEALLAKGAEVTAVELDPALADRLEQRFGDRIVLVRGDILAPEHARRFFDETTGAYSVIANIPYNITSKLIERIVHAGNLPIVARLLVQKEVAERICAEPPQMNSLALMVQLHAKPGILAQVKKSAFYPPPKVDSAILELSFPRKRESMDSRIHGNDMHLRVEKLAKQAFASPRKKIMNTLGVQRPDFAEIGLTGNERPAELSVDQWKKMAQPNGVV